MSYEQIIFVPGRNYRVKQTFASGPTTTLTAGEILSFDRNSYSSYDNCFVYVFRSKHGGGVRKEWWLHEEIPPESWREYFEPVENPTVTSP